MSFYIIKKEKKRMEEACERSDSTWNQYEHDQDQTYTEEDQEGIPLLLMDHLRAVGQGHPPCSM